MEPETQPRLESRTADHDAARIMATAEKIGNALVKGSDRRSPWPNAPEYVSDVASDTWEAVALAGGFASFNVDGLPVIVPTCEATPVDMAREVYRHYDHYRYSVDRVFVLAAKHGRRTDEGGLSAAWETLAPSDRVTLASRYTRGDFTRNNDGTPRSAAECLARADAILSMVQARPAEKVSAMAMLTDGGIRKRESGAGVGDWTMTAAHDAASSHAHDSDANRLAYVMDGATPPGWQSFTPRERAAWDRMMQLAIRHSENVRTSTGRSVDVTETDVLTAAMMPAVYRVVRGRGKLRSGAYVRLAAVADAACRVVEERDATPSDVSALHAAVKKWARNVASESGVIRTERGGNVSYGAAVPSWVGMLRYGGDPA